MDDPASATGLSDIKLLQDIERAILKGFGGKEALQEIFPKMIRKALDEVIDTPRTGRLTLDQIEKTEKTYIGTKVEILFRNLIGFPKGILDLNIDGVEVDIKNTVGSNWTLPPEVLNKPCILISSKETRALCNLGLIVVRPEYLSKGTNRDHKKTIAKASFDKIRWLLHDFPYPKNIWEAADPAHVKRIFNYRGGTERLVQLFKEIQGVPITRTVIEGIAQQKDYMKRLRRNGGARDRLAEEGIALLSGAYDTFSINKLGLPFCTRDEFISYRARNHEERDFLKDKLS
jgi:hypothetical protein